ncbi:MAG: AraC family transcriptional regulator [Bryobacteraceae bacterium]|nr:AraC family transcriptional regulator [Bryobacteraceae bacterium]
MTTNPPSVADRSAGDMLSRILELYQLSASVFANPSTCGPWQLEMPPSPHVEFHLVAAGECFLHLDPGFSQPISLQAGDVVVFPRSRGHLLSQSRHIAASGSQLFQSGTGPRTELVCGTFALAGAQSNPLIMSLADVVIVTGKEAREELKALALLLAREAQQDRSARESVLSRLSEVLFVYVLRHELERGTIRGGLLSAFLDPGLRQVLVAMLDSPGRRWTIAKLAAEAHLSRTAFLERFQGAVGVPPMHFLADWRMRVAETRLRDGSRSVAAVASELGYSTETAFRRAFKRIRGVGPGSVRRRANVEGQ